MGNRVTQELQEQLNVKLQRPQGPIAQIAARYTLDSDRLLGLLLKLDFAESHIATCDPWKLKYS
jgi:hypothetical protein